jgi:outer membrane protein assembly factor BamB
MLWKAAVVEQRACLTRAPGGDLLSDMLASRFLTPFVAVAVVLSVQGYDWPMFRGPSQSGISQEPVDPKLIAGGATLLWKSRVGIGFSSITVAAGRVYTMGNADAADTVWCLDASTGREIWKHSYPEELEPGLYEGGPSATPTISDGRVYTLSRTGKAFCFDAARGTVIWEKDLARETGARKPGWGYAGSPLIHGDLVIYNLGSGGAALNRNKGELAWKSGIGAAGYSTPIAFEQGGEWFAVVMTADSALAFRLTDGKEVWSHPWKTTYDINAADPVVLGNLVFVASGYNHGASVFRVEGGKTSVVWENKSLRSQFSSSVLLNGFLYGIDDRQLRCVDFATGEVKWTDKSTGQGSLIIADGKIVALSEKGELIIAGAAPAGFTPLARAKILDGKCWTSPALANGKLYARNAMGDLVCLELGGK